MIKYYLIIGIGKFILIPEPYGSIDECNKAGETFYSYWCVPAPKERRCRFQTPGIDGHYTVTCE